MIGDERDELFDPSRPWPPLSAWAAAGLLTLPPLAVFGLILLHDPKPAVIVVPGTWVTAAVVAGLRLLVGHRDAIRWATWVLAVFALFVGAMALGIFLGGAYRDLAPALLALIYPLTVAALLWWPETRRWCGLLPPRPEDDP